MFRVKAHVGKWSVLVLLALVAAGAAGLQARTVTEDRAARVAQNWVRHVVARDGAWGPSSSPSVAYLEPVYREGVLVAYKAGVAPCGYVLVPAEDELPAVKAFSTESDFVSGGPGFEEWVTRELEEIVTVLRSGKADASSFEAANPQQWSWLGAAPGEFRVAEAMTGTVSPILLTTNWDQGDPYNLLCPSVGGAKCPVGCVATATSQVMRFWNWPPRGEGSFSYFWNGQTLTANFDHDYDWANMPNVLSYRSSAAEKAAVSTLCYEVAVAFSMSFDPQGSGAYTVDAVTIMPHYFKYGGDIATKGYTGKDSTWFPYFTAQVDKGWPCLLSIRGTGGGHSVVVDGYRTDSGNMVHINMGWGGSSTSYYALNNIVAGGYDFKDLSSQSVVYDIHPNNVVVPVTVTSITKAGSPFRLNVTGSNFQQGITITIGSDTAPWSTVTYKSATSLVIKGGSALKAKVPKGTPTPITFENPDGQSATFTFQW